MAQFDFYENSDEDTRQLIPYLLDVQADILDVLATRVVVPLVKLSSDDKPARYLNPQFEIMGEAVFMSTAEMAGVPLRALGARSGSLKEQRAVIIAAIDFLLTGF